MENYVYKEGIKMTPQYDVLLQEIEKLIFNYDKKIDTNLVLVKIYYALLEIKKNN